MPTSSRAARIQIRVLGAKPSLQMVEEVAEETIGRKTAKSKGYLLGEWQGHLLSWGSCT